MNSLYVQIRGRVKGPFELPMLKVMAQRGQLSRIHLVSEDQQDWLKASEFPEVFEPEVALAEATAGSTDSASKGTVPSPGQSVGISPATEIGAVPSEWYFEKDNEPQGPFSFLELQRKFSEQRLLPNVQVWREGMTKWVAASTIANLSPQSQPTMRKEHRDFKSTFASEVVDRLANGRRWIICVSLASFIVAVLFALCGFNVLFRGMTSSSTMVGLGIVLFVAAIGCSIMGFMAMNYSYTIQNAELMRTDDNVFANLDFMNRCWKFLALFLVTILVAIVGLILTSMFLFNDTTMFGMLPGTPTPPLS